MGFCHEVWARGMLLPEARAEARCAWLPWKHEKCLLGAAGGAHGTNSTMYQMERPLGHGKALVKLLLVSVMEEGIKV